MHCANLTWGVTAVASLGQEWACPEFVVAADVVYHRELFNPLLCSIVSLGKADFAVALMPKMIAMLIASRANITVCHHTCFLP